MIFNTKITKEQEKQMIKNLFWKKAEIEKRIIWLNRKQKEELSKVLIDWSVVREQIFIIDQLKERKKQVDVLIKKLLK